MSLPSVDQLPAHLLDNTYGAELMAAFGATALYGIQCLQTFMYYNAYPKDPIRFKALVAWIWVMATVHEGLVLALEYDLLIVRFGDLAPLFEINKEATIQGIFTILISIPTQFFFLHRIYKLSGNKAIILPVFLVLCIILQLVTGLLYFSWTLSTHDLTDILSGVKRRTGVVYIVSAAFIDLVIAGSMVYLLRSAKVEGMSQTRRMITKLIVLSVNTGLWTALLAVFCAMALIVYPTTFIFIGLYLPISSLYANTLLANLNVRQYVRGTHDVLSLSVMVATPNTGVNTGTGDSSVHFGHQRSTRDDHVYSGGFRKFEET
ncbi:hypothetical protein BDZ89DRAFT_734283 [Hymenopellis radicata]|nr:hypothetical protein BDZ89DRAFT_734283 [Hymenopellis radicata]